MDGPGKRGIQNKPACDGQLKKTPEDRNDRDCIMGPVTDKNQKAENNMDQPKIGEVCCMIFSHNRNPDSRNDNSKDDIKFSGRFRLSSNPFFLLGHLPCQFQAVILVIYFIFAHVITVFKVKKFKVES